MVATDQPASQQPELHAGGLERLRLGPTVVDVPERVVRLRIVGIVDVGVPVPVSAVNDSHPKIHDDCSPYPGILGPPGPSFEAGSAGRVVRGPPPATRRAESTLPPPVTSSAGDGCYCS